MSRTPWIGLIRLDRNPRCPVCGQQLDIHAWHAYDCIVVCVRCNRDRPPEFEAACQAIYRPQLSRYVTLGAGLWWWCPPDYPSNERSTLGMVEARTGQAPHSPLFDPLF